jgi:phage FluMu protein Com
MPAHRRILLGWIPLLITVLSTTGAVFLLSRQLTAEAGQEEQLAASESLTAFPVQIAPGFDGIVLIDHQNRNLCIYQYNARNPAHERLTLLAARNFRYDLQLEDYNNADPRPGTVKEWLERATGNTSSPAKAKGYEGKSTPPPKTESPANANPAWRSLTPEQQKIKPATGELKGDTEPKSSNSGQNLIKPPNLPVKILLKCANPTCDFCGQLSAREFIQAASLQINQLRYRDPQAYAKLAVSARLQLPELDNTSEKKISPIMEREMIEIKLIELWGDVDQRLGFTCIKCGKNEVYKAIECKQCKEIYLPRFVRAGQSSYKCPQCGSINEPGFRKESGAAGGVTREVK